MTARLSAHDVAQGMFLGSIYLVVLFLGWACPHRGDLIWADGIRDGTDYAGSHRFACGLGALILHAE